MGSVRLSMHRQKLGLLVFCAGMYVAASLQGQPCEIPRGDPSLGRAPLPPGWEHAQVAVRVESPEPPLALPQGPVLDWIKDLLAGLWSMLMKLLAAVAAGLAEIRQEFADFRADVAWLPWKIVGVLTLVFLAHAFVTRPRKA